jgi:hypothetical protein
MDILMRSISPEDIFHCSDFDIHYTELESIEGIYSLYSSNICGIMNDDDQLEFWSCIMSFRIKERIDELILEEIINNAKQEKRVNG